MQESKEILEDWKDKVEKYHKNLRLELHPDKSKIYHLYKGVNFLGFKIFYYYKRSRKRNVTHFKEKLTNLKRAYKNGDITKDEFMASIGGWFAYVMWGNTYRLRKKLEEDIKDFLESTVPQSIKIV